MPQNHPCLYLFCGKMAAGKSTLAAELAAPQGNVLISEDHWLSTLYRDQLKTPKDYVDAAQVLRRLLGQHVPELLKAGVSVSLDVPANTVETRGWLRDILSETAVHHEMHVLLPTDAVCLARLKARNAAGDHPFAPTEAQFLQFSRHFVPPHPDEGFNLIHHN